MLKPGDLIGPYEIRGFVGQGGMGQVYRAFDPRLERTVALKVIATSASPSDSGPGKISSDFEARLLREARAVASLSHPNVVAVFDVGEAAGRLYLAMEYVVGSTLRGLSTQEMPLARKVRWLVDAARALDAAHQVGLIHRDIKPENVMVREDGVVKVLDFGIARRAAAATGDQAVIDTVTGGGAIAGTPIYMAPEQIKGADVDARSDQFAWGVMAYELVVGERPWSDAGDLLALVARVMSDPVTPIRARVTDVPEAVDMTILRALSRDPNERFVSMTEVADALEPFAVQTTGGGGGVRIAPSPSPAADDPSAYAATTRVPTSVSLGPAPSKLETSAGKKKRLRLRRKAARLALPLALLMALAAVVVVVKRRVGPTPTGRDAPRPLSTVSEAEASYKDAMRLWHDGASGKANAALHKAVEFDPTFAAAHLELALQTLDADPAGAQASLQRAFEFQHMLVPRDAELLEASEPLVAARPNIDEWETRLAGKVLEFDRDAELQYHLGRARERQHDDEGAKEAYSAAVRLDGRFVPAIAALANTERNLGSMKDALSTTQACVNPLASLCRETRWRILTETGECHSAREEAAEWRRLDPDSPAALSAFARALHADGAARPSVEEALWRRWELLPADARPRLEAWDKTMLAVVDGDLARADQLAKDYDAALPSSADQHQHADPARLRMNMLLERDRPEEAAKVARDYLDRMEAWEVYPFAPDASITFQEPLVRTGAVSRRALDEQRAKWLEREAKRQSGAEQAVMRGAWVAWAFAWGSFVETREEALEALLHVPTEPLPEGGRRSPLLDFNLGRAHALAGRPQQALSHLARVTASCATFDGAMLIVRARWLEGQAYEAAGEIAKARAAYERVVSAWPKTTGSRTVRRAQERLDELSK